jgi:glycosyltransferase involved in cell wall biosynthesis
MKIVIVSNALSGGGAETSMRVINQRLRLSGEDSTLLCLNYTKESDTKVGEMQLGRNWKSGFFQTFSNFFDFYQAIRDLKPDIIVVNCELPELFVAILPKKINRMICVEHTSKPWAGRETLGRLVRGVLWIRKPRWITVNKSQKHIWPLGVKAMHIPNPVETPVLAPEGKNQADFVFVGRIRKEKGIQLVLEATANVKKKIDVFGSGNLEDELKSKYSAIVTFHGFVNDPWRFISPSQILIVASEYEGDGRVIVEGLLAGLPILLLDNSDLRRFGLPDTNYFADEIDLREKMTDCLLDAQKYKFEGTKITELKHERDITFVVDSWRNLLFQD